jgi:hypothetical protein
MKDIHKVKKHFEDLRTKIFKKHGVFFAFSNKQLEEGKVEGVKYVQWMNGGLCPKDNVEVFIKDLNENIKKQDDKLSSSEFRKSYIAYELSNHEAYYTGSIDDSFSALKSSGITEKEVIKVYREEYPKQDL